MIEHRRQLPESHPGGRARQQGAIAVVFAVAILVIFGFIGLAFDLAVLYNRKVELQGVADAAALAGATELIGTTAGVSSAIDQAATVARTFHYQYNKHAVTWSDAAIKFSVSPATTGPDANWLDAAAARATPDGLLFAKVDTSQLEPAYGAIDTFFMRVLSDSLRTTNMSAHSVAGRSTIKVTPLAICALSPIPANSRSNPGPPANTELEEYGFRRGVGYDLMNLNPNGTTAENFVVNPIDPPGVIGQSSNTSAAMVAPFVCAGSMMMPRVMGATISVSRPFPLGALFNHLNSRFDQYAGAACTPSQAPPDANIRQYPFTAIPWMSTAPGAQTAQSTTVGGKLWTIASPLPAPATNTAPMYGPLWSFARAVPFASYTAGLPEPLNGYATFATAAWATLYNPGKPVYTGAASTPYSASAGANFLAPSVANRPGLRFRRVLNVPLLSCPVAAGANASATVLAIGRFFMTVPASATSISAEFAGIVPEQSLGGPVELYP